MLAKNLLEQNVLCLILGLSLIACGGGSNDREELGSGSARPAPIEETDTQDSDRECDESIVWMFETGPICAGPLSNDMFAE